MVPPGADGGKCSEERRVNMDLSTNYMGLRLKNPIVGVSSILSRNLDGIKKLQDAGASAIVMYSIFEELIQREQEEANRVLSAEPFSEASSFFPDMVKFQSMEGEQYLRYLEKVKASMEIPVIGSLNAITPRGWVQYARRMEAIGLNALELHLSSIPTDPGLTSEGLERTYLEIVKSVKEAVSIPVAVKVGSSFSAFANMAKNLELAGADALVLFHRFYVPDIDLETLEMVPDLQLSQPHEMRVPLLWIGILHGQLKASLAAAGGIHTTEDVLKLIMAGADVTMLASALIQHGPKCIRLILDELRTWMEAHKYQSVQQMRGSMSYRSVAEPSRYERTYYMRYMKTLQRL